MHSSKQNIRETSAQLPELLTVCPSPHIRHKDRTWSIMLDVILALLPALIFGIVMAFRADTAYGVNSIFMVLTAVVSCMTMEALFQKWCRRPITVTDGSAALTGVLLAMNLPFTTPIWMILLGSFFAIVVVKQLFGGIGKNIVNPALAARVMLFTSFVSAMSGDAYPSVDGISAATPLVGLKAGTLSPYSLSDLFFGNIPGCLGELSALFLILGGLYLLLRRVITWHIPVSCLLTVALLTFLFPLGGADRVTFMAAELCSGGLLLGAVFMATDYATSPVTPKGRIVYGVLIGLITVFIRYFCGNPEGISFAILIGNLLVWYLDRFTMPKRFGTGGKKYEA